MLMQLKAPGLVWRSARLGVAAAALLLATPFEAQAAPALPYGSYAAERQMILEQLPCKWISMNGHDGIRRDDSGYDFLCKGGVWATVSLMMDEAKLQRDGIGRVRLLFREWPADVHPGGGEAYVAQEFLQYAIAHFVPANMADAVQESFWKNRDREWKIRGLTLKIASEDMGNHTMRRLEIFGSIGAVTPLVTMPTTVSTAKVAPVLPIAVVPVTDAPVPLPVATTPIDKAPPREGWMRVQKNLPVVVVTPTAALEPVKAVPVVAAKPVADVKKAEPKKKGGWKWLFNPAEYAAETSGPVEPSQSVVLPVKAVANVIASPSVAVLVPVVSPTVTVVSGSTPPVFAAEVAPESLVAPVPPPEISTTLVPSALDLTVGRAAAPGAFDAYKKAEALTRNYELKALEDPNAMKKVTAATPAPETQAAQDSGLMKAPEPQSVAPALAPVPTPNVGTPTPTTAGLLTVDTVPADNAAAIPATDPRFVPERPMPQLKYVPKAQPAPKPDQVIKFEDEKSGL